MFDEEALHAVVGLARFFEVWLMWLNVAAKDAEFVCGSSVMRAW